MNSFTLVDWYKELCAEADTEPLDGIGHKLRQGYRSWLEWYRYCFEDSDSAGRYSLSCRAEMVIGTLQSYIDQEDAKVLAEIPWDTKHQTRYLHYLADVPQDSRARIMLVLEHYMPQVCSPRKMIFAHDMQLLGLGSDLKNWVLENVGTRYVNYPKVARRSYIHALVNCCYDPETTLAEALKLFALVQAYQPTEKWNGYSSPPPATWCATIREWCLAGRPVDPVEYEELMQMDQKYLWLWFAVPELSAVTDPEVVQQWADCHLDSQMKHFESQSGSLANKATQFAALARQLETIPPETARRVVSLGLKHRSAGLRSIGESINNFDKILVDALSWVQPSQVANVIGWLREVDATSALDEIQEIISTTTDAGLRSALQGVVWQGGEHQVPWRSAESLSDFALQSCPIDVRLAWLQVDTLPSLQWAESGHDVDQNVSQSLLGFLAFAGFCPSNPELQSLPKLFTVESFEQWAREVMDRWIVCDLDCASQTSGTSCAGDGSVNAQEFQGLLTPAALADSGILSASVVGYLRQHHRRVDQCRALLEVLAHNASDETICRLHELSLAHPATWIVREAESKIRNVAEARGLLVDDLLEMFPPKFEWALTSGEISGASAARAPWSHDETLRRICGDQVTSKHVGVVWQRVVSGFLERCDRAIRADHQWNPKVWSQRYVTNPLMNQLARSVTWVAVDNTGQREIFQVDTNQTCLNISGEQINLSGKSIMVAHPAGPECTGLDEDGTAVGVDPKQFAGLCERTSDVLPIGSRPDFSEYRVGEPVDLYRVQTAAQRIGYEMVPDQGSVSQWVWTSARSGVKFCLHHTLAPLPLSRHTVVWRGVSFRDQDGQPLELASVSPQILAEVRTDVDRIIDASPVGESTSRRLSPQASPHEQRDRDHALPISQRLAWTVEQRHGLEVGEGVGQGSESIFELYAQASEEVGYSDALDLENLSTSTALLDSTQALIPGLAPYYQDMLYSDGLTTLHAIDYWVESWRAQHRKPPLPGLTVDETTWSRYEELIADLSETAQETLRDILQVYLPAESSAAELVCRLDSRFAGASPQGTRIWLLEQFKAQRWNVTPVLPESPVAVLLKRCSDADVSVMEAAKLVRLVEAYHPSGGYLCLQVPATPSQVAIAHWSRSGRRVPRKKFAEYIG